MNGYLNGRSQTIFTMISSCFGALILRIPLIYLVSTHTPDNLTRIGSIAPAVLIFHGRLHLLIPHPQLPP